MSGQARAHEVVQDVEYLKRLVGTPARNQALMEAGQMSHEFRMILNDAADKDLRKLAPDLARRVIELAAENSRLAAREREFAALMGVGDGGQYRADWEARAASIAEQAAELARAQAGAQAVERALKRVEYLADLSEQHAAAYRKDFEYSLKKSERRADEEGCHQYARAGLEIYSGQAEMLREALALAQEGKQ